MLKNARAYTSHRLCTTGVLQNQPRQKNPELNTAHDVFGAPYRTVDERRNVQGACILTFLRAGDKKEHKNSLRQVDT